jgi:MYXO-CTERM domain-containing protein
MSRDTSRICPKTGKRVLVERISFWAPLVAGISAIGWFLLRVIPKPSRASYPCQRAALATAGGFIVWLGGLAGFAAIFRRSMNGMRRTSIPAGIIGGMAMVGGATWMVFAQPAEPAAAAPVWTPHDAPNTPIGVPRGIYPGRVTWARDPLATKYDATKASPTYHWWDPTTTDQGRVEAMLSATLQGLSGGTTDAAAWDLIFKYYNKTHGKGDVGYTAGQKIAIKINQNNGRSTVHTGNASTNANDSLLNGSPQLVLATVRQLVNNAKVASADIYVYDVVRLIGDSIYAYCKADATVCSGVHFVDKIGGDGREAGDNEQTTPWAKNVLTYGAAPALGLGKNLPQFVVDAAYMINMPIPKNHGNMGPTLAMKNHYGTVHGLDHTACAQGQHHGLVELAASKHVGEKTVLFLYDFLYGSDGPDGGPKLWNMAPFNKSWPASIMASLDGVAIDSVGFDFVNAEMGMQAEGDNNLHEAALANNPPSGIPYKPNGDGVSAISLGVHEHWNNATDQKYTRDLGTGLGIQLFRVTPGAPVDAGTPIIDATTGAGGAAGAGGAGGAGGTAGAAGAGTAGAAGAGTAGAAGAGTAGAAGAGTAGAAGAGTAGAAGAGTAGAAGAGTAGAAGSATAGAAGAGTAGAAGTTGAAGAAAADTATDAGGCSCRLGTNSNAASGVTWAGLLLGLLAIRRRRH